MKQLPNLFTLLNLVFGCIAIIYILQNGIIIFADNGGSQLIDIPEKIWMASLFIGLAGVIDFLDGFFARLFKSSSHLGRELDSLADLVSFGVAPGMIIYQFLRLSFAQQEGGLDVSFLWLLPSLLLPCAAAYRLARFNLDASQSYSFKGLPVPAVGILVASLPLIYWNVHEPWVAKLLLNKWFLYGFIVLLGYLMISGLSIMSLKFKDYSWKNNFPKYIFIIISIITLALLKWLAVPVIFILYIFLSFFSKDDSASFVGVSEGAVGIKNGG